MGIFSWFFSAKKPEKQEEVVEKISSANTSGIRYDPELVPALKQDHQALLGLYTVIKQAAENRRYEEIGPRLVELKRALQTHLVVENVRFYAYVQQGLAQDSDASSLIAGLRKEMDGIAHAAIKFVNRYETIAFTDEVAKAFLQELAAIGSVLVQRISTEESRLYTLYMPSY